MAQHNAIGRYEVEVIAQGFGESKNKGTPFFFLEVTPRYLLKNEFRTAVDGKYNRMITLYLTDKTADRVRKDLAELGWEGSSFRELDPLVEGHKSFVDTLIIADCQHEGQFEKWELPYEPMSSAPKESVPNLSRKLDTLFGKTTAAKKPAPKAEPARQPAATGAAAKGDDEIPF